MFIIKIFQERITRKGARLNQTFGRKYFNFRYSFKKKPIEKPGLTESIRKFQLNQQISNFTRKLPTKETEDNTYAEIMQKINT
jgi:hypothetical protein